ncbi:MAG: hypothetical protein HC897_14460 [Thermoanaerobaculia bacterium]|nr:hypothetical protein [Thermoanaerobaculia bacterium]
MLRKTLLLSVAGFAATFLAFAQPAPVGRPFLVSTATEITVSAADLSVAADGRFVAVWGATTNSLGGSESRIMARVFDAQGRPLTGELRVASGSSLSTYSPFVALLEPDVFLVGWLESRVVFARRYGFDGRPRGRSFELVRPEDPASSFFVLTQTCADAQGRFLLYWREDLRLLARRFDHRARPLGELIEVATTDHYGSADMALGCNAAGEFALVGTGDPTASDSLWVRRWDGEGRSLGAALEVTAGENTFGPTVALAEDGHFAVAWGSGSRKHRARFFRPDGRPLGRAKTVLTLDVGVNRLGSYDFLALADGDFLQLWHDLALRVGGIPDPVVFAQRFAPTAAVVAMVSSCASLPDPRPGTSRCAATPSTV